MMILLTLISSQMSNSFLSFIYIFLNRVYVFWKAPKTSIINKNDFRGLKDVIKNICLWEKKFEPI